MYSNSRKTVTMIYWALIPILDQPIPASRENFTRFMGMPQYGDTNSIVGFPFFVQLCCFPVPDVTLSISISGYQVTKIKKNVNSC